MGIISSDIEQAAKLLTKGDLVAIPTETVYGLAGNIYNETAIQKIFTLKQRPFYNPLIVHTHAVDQLDRYVSKLPKKAEQLAEAFWPGPLTMILPKHPSIPDLVTAGKDTVGIRIPNHPLTLALLEQLDFPLAAPSANPFGSISPTTAEHVASYFKEGLQMVLDGGPCKRGIESTIVGFEGTQPVIYRLGSIAMEDIESLIGPVPLLNKKEHAPNAPGMLSRHYAPNTKTVLVDGVEAYIQERPDLKIGLITLATEINAPQIIKVIQLSKTGDLTEAAARLYAALHQLDQYDLDLIVAERFPDQGLGRSINDRLERATKRK